MGRTNDRDARVTFITVVPWILISVTQLSFTIITGLPSGITKGIFAISHPAQLWLFLSIGLLKSISLTNHASLPFVLSFGGTHLSTDSWIESGVSPPHTLSYRREGDNECHFHRWARRTTGPHEHLHPGSSDKFWSLSFHWIFVCRSSHRPSAHTSALVSVRRLCWSRGKYHFSIIIFLLEKNLILTLRKGITGKNSHFRLMASLSWAPKTSTQTSVYRQDSQVS